MREGEGETEREHGRGGRRASKSEIRITPLLAVDGCVRGVRRADETAKTVLCAVLLGFALCFASLQIVSNSHLRVPSSWSAKTF